MVAAITVAYGGGSRHFSDAFRAVEEAAKASGLERTILRCADFDMGAMAWAPQIRTAGAGRGVYGDGATSSIHERDIAAVSALALTDAVHTGHTYVLTGPQSRSPTSSQRTRNRPAIAILGPKSCPKTASSTLFRYDGPVL